MRLFDGIKRAVAGLGLGFKKAYELSRIGYGVNGLPPFPNREAKALNSWYRRNELVYACIQKKAEASQDPEPIVEKKQGDLWKRVDGHPLRRLLIRPNPEMDGATFMSLWVTSEQVAGYFAAEIVRNKVGQPLQLWPLDPAMIKPVQGGYEYGDHRNKVKLSARDVLFSKLPDLCNPFAGLSPLSVALGAVEADSLQTDYVRAFFQNSGIPSIAIVVSGRSLTREQADEIRRKWIARHGAGGEAEAGPAVLDQNAKLEKIGSNLSEIDGGTLRQQIESRICAVFGVPPLLVGAYVGLANVNQRASAIEAQRDFWMNTMSPLFKRYRQFLTWRLLPEFEGESPVLNERWRVGWDMSNVMALQEDVASKHMRAREDFRAGAITLNTFEGTVGLPLSMGGDYFLRQVNRIPVTPDVVAAQAEAAAAAASASVAIILTGSRDPEGGSGDSEGKGRKSARKVYLWDGLECGREPTDFERQINVKSLGQLQSSSSSNLSSRLSLTRSALISDAVSKLRQIADPADYHKLILDWPATSRADLTSLIGSAWVDGRAGFHAELLAQGDPQEVAGRTADAHISTSRLDLIADTAISRMVNEVQSRAVSTALHLAPLISRTELPGRVEERLKSDSPAYVERIARDAANQAIAFGREVETDRWEIGGGFIYSAVLDRRTCDVCRSLDGFMAARFADMPIVPNPACGEGFGACRCAILPVF